MFKRTRLVLEKLSFSLEQMENDKELKNYFTQYILIIFYNEFEENLKEALQQFLEIHSSKNLSQFIHRAMGSIFKRIDKQDLVKTIGYFGDEKKRKFIDSIPAPDLQKYQNFIESRHKAAHSDSAISVSWEEARVAPEIGERIIRAISQSLFPSDSLISRS